MYPNFIKVVKFIVIKLIFEVIFQLVQIIYINDSLYDYKDIGIEDIAKKDIEFFDLFKTGDTFSISSYKKQFPGSTKFNNGNSFNWSVSFDSVTSSGMTITCTLN